MLDSSLQLDMEQLCRDVFDGMDWVYPDTTNLISPFNDPQRKVIATLADETFFGGSAGGGKSFGLLILALTKHRESIIFRRMNNEVEHLYDESYKILQNSSATYNQNKHLWTNIPGDRRLQLAGLQYETSIGKWQGHPHDFLGFDEITNFTENQFRTLTTWNRTSHSNQRVRVVATGNPPMNADGMWVIKYWGAWLDPEHPNPAKDGELRWYVSVEDEDIELLSGDPYWTGKEWLTPRSRTFIRASVYDNPIYMRNGYKAVLDSLPEVLRRRMRDGEFVVNIDDPSDQCIPTMDVVRAQKDHWKEPQGNHTWISAGLDVARGGKDNNCLAGFDGQSISKLIIVPGKRTPTGRDCVKQVGKFVLKGTKLYIDAITWGADAYERFKDDKYNCEAVQVNTASVARDKSRRYGFFNLRSELYWRLREAISPDSDNPIGLPPDRQLLIELCSFKFEIVGTKIKLEDKLSVKKRLGYSPDRAEAVILALKHLRKHATAGYMSNWNAD